MIVLRIYFSVFLFLTFFTPLAAESANVYDLSVSRKESGLVEIAIPPFKTSPVSNQMGEKIASVIASDLKFAGHFLTISNNYQVSELGLKDIRENRINFEQWRNLSHHFLMKGELFTLAGNKVGMKVSIYNVINKKVIFTTAQQASGSQIRLMAHIIADQFLKYLLDEDGIFTTRIAYISRSGKTKELHIMDYDGENKNILTQDKSLVLFPDINKKGDKIVFTSYLNRNPDLYLIDLVTKGRKIISQKLGLNTTGEFSPASSQVVFSLSYRGNSEIYLANEDGTNLKRLTVSKAIETSPTFSDDGKYILFTSDRTGSPQLYVMQSNGANVRRLTKSGIYNTTGSWSPLGDYIAYTSSNDGSRFNIAMIDATDIDSDKQRSVFYVTSNGNNESPSFSPNGLHITFASSRRGISQIFITNRTGLNQTQITFTAGGGYSPSWGGSILNLAK